MRAAGCCSSTRRTDWRRAWRAWTRSLWKSSSTLVGANGSSGEYPDNRDSGWLYRVDGSILYREPRPGGAVQQASGVPELHAPGVPRYPGPIVCRGPSRMVHPDSMRPRFASWCSRRSSRSSSYPDFANARDVQSLRERIQEKRDERVYGDQIEPGPGSLRITREDITKGLESWLRSRFPRD